MPPPTPATVFVDDIASLHAFLGKLTSLDLTTRNTTVPSLYIDLEGINLSRHGNVSLLTVFLLPNKTSYIIDITTLGGQAFTSASVTDPKTTLQTILEEESVPKVFFDVRNDSNALFFHYQISLAGIIDVQLLELGSRKGGLDKKRTVCGLARCIKAEAMLSPVEKLGWEFVKNQGKLLFAPENGGRYEVFDERPLSKEMIDYCVQDVKFLPGLWGFYTRRLANNQEWAEMIEQAALERVKESQRLSYEPKSRGKALGPWL